VSSPIDTQDKVNPKRINPVYVIIDLIFMVEIFTLGKKFNQLLRIMKSTQTMRLIFSIQERHLALGMKAQHDLLLMRNARLVHTHARLIKA